MLLFTLSKSRKSENSALLVSPYRLTLALLLLGLFIVGLTFFNWWFNIADLIPILPAIFRLITMNLINFIVLNLLINKLLKINK